MIYKNNLLELALSVIPRTSFKWKSFLGNSINSFGITTANYSEPIECSGYIGEVDNNLYQQLGLDFSKDYKTVISSNNIKGIEQQEQPDLIIIDNETYSVIKNATWIKYNGWNAVLVIKEKAAENDQE